MNRAFGIINFAGNHIKVDGLQDFRPVGAFSFLGRYRIIDFPLSNCVNSKIDTVGILTQYQPLELNEYIGNGQPWGLNSSHGGVQVLPPYAKSKNSEWYKGTANAIYQNIGFIQRYNPDNVLILSGDHIYKMDYAAMLRFHESMESDCTIAVRDVPLKEASRFGIMNTREDGSIYEFEEKPKAPKSTNASMGIYIFKWSVLKEFLEADEADPTSENDFGKNIIPALLNSGHRLFAYQFDGYWKGVGTISSLWEANMDVLTGEELHLDDDKWKIYARNNAEPPHYVAPTGNVINCLVSEGTVINGTVKNSIISHSVKIGKDVYIEDSVIMPGAVIEDGADIRYSIVGWNATVGKNCMVGETLEHCNPGEWKISVIAPNYNLAPNSVVGANEMIG